MTDVEWAKLIHRMIITIPNVAKMQEKIRRLMRLTVFLCKELSLLIANCQRSSSEENDKSGVRVFKSTISWMSFILHDKIALCTPAKPIKKLLMSTHSKSLFKTVDHAKLVRTFTAAPIIAPLINEKTSLLALPNFIEKPSSLVNFVDI